MPGPSPQVAADIEEILGRVFEHAAEVERYTIPVSELAEAFKAETGSAFEQRSPPDRLVTCIAFSAFISLRCSCVLDLFS